MTITTVSIKMGVQTKKNTEGTKMTRAEIINKMLDKGMTYRDAAEAARKLEARAVYLTKTLGSNIEVEDIIDITEEII